MNVGPDGNRGWWHIGTGLGYLDAAPMSWRGVEGNFIEWTATETPAIRRAGWPFHSLESVVRVVKKDDPPYAKAMWELPAGEIVNRGVATDRLPRWLHAKPGRRLPVMPILTGFLCNTVLYSVAASSCHSVVAGAWRMRQSSRPGFPVGQAAPLQQ